MMIGAMGREYKDTGGKLVRMGTQDLLKDADKFGPMAGNPDDLLFGSPGKGGASRPRSNRASVSLGRRRPSAAGADPIKGWRIAEIQLAYREFDRKKKGFLNSTELRRLLINFGVAWKMIKAYVPPNHYWDFEATLEKVQKLQPADAIADKIWNMFQHTDRQEQRDSKCNGKVKGKEFVKNLNDHGLSQDDIYILLFKYSNGQLNDRKPGRVQGQIGYGDLHRDIFPTDGWETAKYWQQFEELYYNAVDPGSPGRGTDPGSPTSPRTPLSPLEPISPRGWGGNASYD